jgi:hypothetical protein
MWKIFSKQLAGYFHPKRKNETHEIGFFHDFTDSGEDKSLLTWQRNTIIP